MLNYCDVREISNELRKDNIITFSYKTWKASIPQDPSERKLKATAKP